MRTGKIDVVLKTDRFGAQSVISEEIDNYHTDGGVLYYAQKNPDGSWKKQVGIPLANIKQFTVKTIDAKEREKNVRS